MHVVRKTTRNKPLIKIQQRLIIFPDAFKAEATQMSFHAIYNQPDPINSE